MSLRRIAQFRRAAGWLGSLLIVPVLGCARGGDAGPSPVAAGQRPPLPQNNPHLPQQARLLAASNAAAMSNAERQTGAQRIAPLSAKAGAAKP